MTRFIIRRLLRQHPGPARDRLHRVRRSPGSSPATRASPTLGERATDARLRRVRRPLRPRPADPRSVRRSTCRTLAQRRPRARRSKFGRPVTRAPRRAAADDHRADASRAAVRDRRRHPAGHRLRVPAQLPADVGTMIVANLGVSMPVFVLGLLLAYRLRDRAQGHAVRAAAIGPAELGRRGRSPLAEAWGLQDLDGPAAGDPRLLSGIYTLTRSHHGPVGASSSTRFRHLILPAIALGTIPLAIIARITRSSLLDVLGLDYVRTARAKGLARAARASSATRCATRCCRS